MIIKLKDEPLITEFISIVAKVRDYLENVLKSSDRLMSAEWYAECRKNLRSHNRFYELGNIKLLNISGKSKSTLKNFDETCLLFRVYYKWLKKSLRTFEPDHPMGKLEVLFDKIDGRINSAYDPFIKINKNYRRHSNVPKPNSSELVIKIFFDLQTISDQFMPKKNRYFGSNLEKEIRLVALQSAKALELRKNLISAWLEIYTNTVTDESTPEKLEDIQKFLNRNVNQSDPDLFIENLKVLTDMSTKGIERITARINMWPIHEYMFLRHATIVLRQDNTTILEQRHFQNVPSIPVDLLAALQGISVKPDLRPILFLKICKFGLGDFKQILNWKYSPQSEVEEKKETRLVGPIFATILTDLLLNKSDLGQIVVTTTLGSSECRNEQLSLLKELMWRNSASTNSQEFCDDYNDLRILR